MAGEVEEGCPWQFAAWWIDGGDNTELEKAAICRNVLSAGCLWNVSKDKKKLVPPRALQPGKVERWT